MTVAGATTTALLDEPPKFESARRKIHVRLPVMLRRIHCQFSLSGYCVHRISPPTTDRWSAKVSTPCSRSTESTRTTGASLESSIAATIALSLAVSRLRSNCSRDSHSSTSNNDFRLSRSEKRRAERQPGATRVGSRIEPSVRSNAVRTWSATTISIENTIKVDFFLSPSAVASDNFIRHFARSGPSAMRRALERKSFARTCP